MKFGKNLIQVVDLSNPEWGQFWINYKFLKRKINEIVELRPSDPQQIPLCLPSDPKEISKNAAEVEFFSQLKKEVKKTSQFFQCCLQEYQLRWDRIWDSYLMLREKSIVHDKNTWTRLLMACVRFYKDVLLLENFAIMNYCGFSKILKKHDKVTGYITRDAYMRHVINQQNFTHYPTVLDLIRKSEQLFQDIQRMESAMPLQDEERLFIDAIRDMNYQASRIQAEESQDSHSPVIPKDRSSLNMQITDNTSFSGIGKTNPCAVISKAHSPSIEETSISQATTVSTAAGQISIQTTICSTVCNTEEKAKSVDIPTSQQLSDGLDAATLLAVDAAKKLGQNHVAPNLPLVFSWMQKVAGNKHPREEQLHHHLLPIGDGKREVIGQNHADVESIKRVRST